VVRNRRSVHFHDADSLYPIKNIMLGRNAI
jgi:hypothetical protein